MDLSAIKARHEADCIRNWDERNAMQIHMDRHDLIAALDELSKPENSAKAIIAGGAIVIRVPIENLPTIVEGAWAAGGMDVRYIVTDPAVFAKELTYALDREEEDGTTPIHRMFDACIDDAINQGAEGIDEHPEQEA